MLDRITHLFQTILSVDQRLIFLHFAILVLFFVAAICLVNYAQAHDWFVKMSARLKANLAEQEKLREKEYKRRIEIEGEFKEKNRMRKITEKLVDCGLKEKYPEITAELFLTAVFSIAVTAIGFVYIFTKSAVFSIACGMVSVLLVYIWLEVKITKNYNAIEKEILKFINILENMSYSEGNIAEMLGGTVPGVNP